MDIGCVNKIAVVAAAVAVVMLASSARVRATEVASYSLPGETMIVVFAALHGNREDSSQPGSSDTSCGAVQWRGVENAIAAEWAINAINNQTRPEHSIGVRVVDTCDSEAVAVQQLMALLNNASSDTPILGVVSVDKRSNVLLPLLSSHSVPLVVTSPEASYDLAAAPTLFVAAPHLNTQMQSVVAAVGRLVQRGVGRVGVMWSCERSRKVLQREAAAAGLVITLIRHLGPHNNSVKADAVAEQILDFALDNNLGPGDVSVLLLRVSEFSDLVEGAPGRAVVAALRQLGVRWLMAMVEDDPLMHELDILRLNELLPGVVVVGPHSSHLRALQQHLSDEVCTDTDRVSVIDPVLHRYCQKIADQSFPLAGSSGGSRSVSVDASHSAAALRAVSTLAAAYRMVQLDHCTVMDNCTATIRHTLPYKMVDVLKRLSYSDGDAPDSLRYVADGRLAITFSIVTVVRGEVIKIGLFREGAGVEWTGEAIPAVPVRMFRLSQPLMVHRPHTKVVHKHQQLNKQHGHNEQSDSEWRTAVWAVFVCVVAAAGLVTCGCLGTYVAIRTCEGTMHGSEVSSVLVLVGTCGVLVGSIVMILPVAVVDMAVLCCMQHLLPYISLSIAYAALATKALIIRVKQSLDSASQIPHPVLYLPLAALVALAVVFAVLGDQTTLHFILPNEVIAPSREAGSSHVIDLQAASLYDHTDVVSDVTFQTIEICKRLDQIPAIIGFVYLMLLLLVTVFMLATAKSNKNNQEFVTECRRVMAVCGISVPLVGVWGAVSTYGPLHLQQPLAALALLLLAYALIAIFLLPKLIYMTSPNVKQFSHKPLGMNGGVSTVFAPTTGQTVSYSSSGDGGGCHFSDVIMCNDMIDKYKLREGSETGGGCNTKHSTQTCNSQASTVKCCNCKQDSAKLSLY